MTQVPPKRPATRTWLTAVTAILTVVGLWALTTIPAYVSARAAKFDPSDVERPSAPSADPFVRALGLPSATVATESTDQILSATCSDATTVRWSEPGTGGWMVFLADCTSGFDAAADLNTHLPFTTEWEGSEIIGDPPAEVNVHAANGMRTKIWVQGTMQIWVATDCNDDACMERLDEVALLAMESFPGKPQSASTIATQRMLWALIGSALVLFVAPLVIARLMRRRIDSPAVLSAPDGVPAYRDVTPLARRAAQGLVWSKRARGTAIALSAVAATAMLANERPPAVFWIVLTALILAATATWYLLRRRAPEVRRRVRVVSSRPVVAVGRGLCRGAAIYVPIWVVSTVILFIWFITAANGAPELRDATLEQVRAPMLGLSPTAFIATLAVLMGSHPLLGLLLIGLLPITAAYFLDRVGQRLSAPTSTELMAADSRPPVLYLRSFDEDTLTLASSATIRTVMQRISPWRRRRFEEFLAEELGKLGPVVAISPPGTKLPPLGAARMTLGNDEWQSRVHEIAQRAVCVVMSATPDQVREGLRWEISYLGTHVQHGRILLVVAPWKPQEVRRRFGAFLQVASDFPMFRWLRGYPAPDGTHVLWRVPDGRWRSLGARWRDDISYTVILDQAVNENLEAWTHAAHASWAPPSAPSAPGSGQGHPVAGAAGGEPHPAGPPAGPLQTPPGPAAGQGFPGPPMSH